MKLIIDKLLKVESADRTKWQIIFWWEYRRLLYNAIVLVAGIISILILFVLSYFISNPEEVGSDGGESFFLLILFPIQCNVFYTLGWFTELFIKKSKTYGPKMFKIGLGFTLFWVFVPILIFVIISVFS